MPRPPVKGPGGPSPADPAVVAKRPAAAAKPPTRPARSLFQRRQTDLPLQRDGTGRFLPWVIALMVYLAGLAIAMGIAFDGAIDRWNRGMAGTVTVQLPRPVAQSPSKAPNASKGASVDAVLALLRATPGIASAQLLDQKAQAALLEPWLGANIDLDLLPVPALVDVRLTDGAALDKAALSGSLASVYPGAVVEDNGQWLDRLMRVAGIAEGAAIVTVLLIGGAAVLTVVFTTRTGLLIHAAVIELLHVMGARDSYIARQFQWHAFGLALRGGLLGFGAAAVTLLALSWAGAVAGVLADSPALPPFYLPPIGWLALAALPPMVGLIGLVTARITVLRSLAKMP
ncbi:MAG TPA: cell division protein [Stellaceae bacterium]|nr:cell division protein [Stellaceae bacterium]